MIFAFARSHPKATFVQVGAHDGTQLDPLREEVLARRWNGVMVEPVPYVFERLRANYGRNRRLALENVAIADADGTRDFHHLAQAPSGAAPWRWYDALGSFDRSVLLSHRELIPDIESRLITTPVPCMTFASLCRKHGLTQVDLVQIDTEGYDAEVIKGIDLGGLGVQLVMYEILHLDAATRSDTEARLRAAGFELLSDGMDTLALHERTLRSDPSLRSVWDRLQAAEQP